MEAIGNILKYGSKIYFRSRYRDPHVIFFCSCFFLKNLFFLFLVTIDELGHPIDSCTLSGVKESQRSGTTTPSHGFPVASDGFSTTSGQGFAASLQCPVKGVGLPCGSWIHRQSGRQHLDPQCDVVAIARGHIKRPRGRVRFVFG